MKESIEAWFDDADIESGKLYELFIALNVDWFHCCKWAAAADSGLNLKHDLTTELVIKQMCDEILFEIWFVRISNVVDISYSEVCFLMTDRMRILDNHVKQCDKTFILFLSFIFITDEIKVDEEFLKMTVF